MKRVPSDPRIEPVVGRCSTGVGDHPGTSWCSRHTVFFFCSFFFFWWVIFPTSFHSSIHSLVRSFEKRDNRPVQLDGRDAYTHILRAVWRAEHLDSGFHTHKLPSNHTACQLPLSPPISLSLMLSCYPVLLLSRLVSRDWLFISEERGCVHFRGKTRARWPVQSNTESHTNKTAIHIRMPQSLLQQQQ